MHLSITKKFLNFPDEYGRTFRVCFFFFFFHLLSGFRGFPGAVAVSIASVSVDANIISNVLKLCSEALPQRCLFFFLQPCGWTN